MFICNNLEMESIQSHFTFIFLFNLTLLPAGHFVLTCFDKTFPANSISLREWEVIVVVAIIISIGVEGEWTHRSTGVNVFLTSFSEEIYPSYVWTVIIVCVISIKSRYDKRCKDLTQALLGVVEIFVVSLVTKRKHFQYPCH